VVLVASETAENTRFSPTSQFAFFAHFSLRTANPPLPPLFRPSHRFLLFSSFLPVLIFASKSRKNEIPSESS
jgi:hypothetical protein